MTGVQIKREALDTDMDMYGGRQRQYKETEGEDSHLQAKKRGLNKSFCQSLEGRNPANTSASDLASRV